MIHINIWLVLIHIYYIACRWFGKCWYVHNLLKYEFDIEFDVSLLLLKKYQMIFHAGYCDPNTQDIARLSESIKNMSHYDSIF